MGVCLNVTGVKDSVIKFSNYLYFILVDFFENCS
jgi:hypothetical protein